MLLFEGYLSSWSQLQAVIVARFVSGDSNPSPEELPVLRVEAVSEEGTLHIIQALSELRDEESWLYISYLPGGPLEIESEFGQSYSLSGSSLKVEQVAYEAPDLLRLAQINFEQASAERLKNEALAKRLGRVQALLQEQQARVTIKAAGHVTGTTARTLYEQHLSFLDRLRAETEA